MVEDALTRDRASNPVISDEEHVFGGNLKSWLNVQASLARKTDATLLSKDADELLVGTIENDNSICQAMNASAEHARLCDLDCGRSAGQALDKGRIEFRCHAGLHCFAAPVRVGGRQLVVLGGRSFKSVGEYESFLRRYDDLPGVTDGTALKNVRFLDAREFTSVADLVCSAARNQSTAFRSIPGGQLDGPRRLLNAQLEIMRLSQELEGKNQAFSRLTEFLKEASDDTDSKRDFNWVLNKLSGLMKAERGSLMLLDQGSGELALEAAVGFTPPPTRVKPGEAVAGAVFASGSPMLVRDVDNEPGVPPARRSQYKSKSFISYPIVMGSRKIGVINLTGRTDGSPYAPEDLSLVELMVPHLALMIDRGRWHKKAEEFQQMSLTDPLTGLPNRRYLEERLFEEVERSKRHGTPLCFMIIDVDNFKGYNDVYGHTSADHVLVKTAQILRRCVRMIDMSSRFAGDEFCIIMPETELPAAARIAERLRAEIAKAQYVAEDGKSMGRITISVGVSAFGRNQNTPRSIIETADRALYKAKTRGRNCVVIHEEQQTFKGSAESQGGKNFSRAGSR